MNHSYKYIPDMPALCHRHSYVDDIARYVSAVQLNRYLVVGVGCSTVDHYEIKLFHTISGLLSLQQLYQMNTHILQALDIS